MVEVQIPRLLESERPVVSGHVSHGTDEHLAQGWVDVEEESSVDVPRAHLAKVGLVPADPGGLGDLVETGPEVQEHQGQKARVPVGGETTGGRSAKERFGNSYREDKSFKVVKL